MFFEGKSSCKQEYVQKGPKKQGKGQLLQAFTEREKCWRAEKDLESWNEHKVGGEKKEI